MICNKHNSFLLRNWKIKRSELDLIHTHFLNDPPPPLHNEINFIVLNYIVFNVSLKLIGCI